MRRLITLCFALLLAGSYAQAQRFMDRLDRGLVAVKVGGNTMVSWRRLGEEYYNVTYNVYRNGTRIATGLTVSNYTDATNSSNTYQVAAVVNGVEQTKCAEVTPWGYVGNSSGRAGYLDLPLHTPVYARDGITDMTDQYRPNDIEMADLNGDGKLDILLKRQSVIDGADYYLPRTSEAEKAYDLIEAYTFDYQTGSMTRLWWIDVGPNMVSLNSTELNMLAYDWDEDGRAEVLLRGADGMIIHTASGESITIGDPSVDTRNTVTHAANATFTNSGAEYLIYLNGTTGEVYDNIEYPLKRLEDGETDVPTAWRYSAAEGGGLLGHRDSKYFMGAPFLDGRTASIFLGRGIYTRIKMAAYDVNRATHKLVPRWRWACNDKSSPWYGNGYHNYVIADVDEDGRDEIVYGSMVIDDNGKGLSTTGYQHGDALHVRDFDPYRKGLEVYACLEDEPFWGSNYRNGTTSEVYYKYSTPVSGGKAGDDGRCLAGNFFDDIPGSQGRSVFSGMVGLSTDEDGKSVEIFSHDETEAWVDYSWLNFRIYWDGDLLDEILDSPAGGTDDNHEGAIIKYNRISTDGKGTRIFNASGSRLNNSTKNNACFVGDILGDWREEFILRMSNTSMRLYTTVVATEYPIYTLWHDKQYRQAMGTQMQVYNLPPNPSFFLGELEGITVAPPPVTNTGRTEISNGGSITAAHNSDHVMLAETNDMTVAVSSGASPLVFTDNAPSWVQGTDVNGTTGTKVKTDGSVGVTNLPPINYIYYTHTLTGAGFTGATQVAKQGGGTLVLPAVEQTYTGPTKVWEGTLQFDGTLTSSPLWMNRHTVLNTTGGTFNAGITMEYGSKLNLGGDAAGTVSSVTATDLTLNFGSEVVFDVVGTGAADNDRVNVSGTLSIEQKTGVWETYGPAHKAPVFVFRSAEELATGDYPIGTIESFGTDDAATAIAKLETDLTGLVCESAELRYDAGTKVLYLHIEEITLPAYGGELDIILSGMVTYHVDAADYPSAAAETFYLPVVTATATPFDDGSGNTVTPWLTGTFTSLLDGTVTDLGSTKPATLYAEDYESTSSAGDWQWKDENTSALWSFNTDNTRYVKFLNNTSGSNRSSYKQFYATGSDFYGTYGKYAVEFDAKLNKAVISGTKGQNVIALYGEGATPPTSSGIIADKTDTYLFKLKGGGQDSRSDAQPDAYTLMYDNATPAIPDGTWCHYTIIIDKANAQLSYAIKNGATTVATGSYALSGTVSKNVQGMVVGAGKSTGAVSIDNISIQSVGEDFSSYTFTEPGTLELKAHADGYKTLTRTFEAPIYYMYYDSPAYNELTADNVQTTLGWSTATLANTRWANWNTSSKTNYDVVSSDILQDYVDNGHMLKISRGNGSSPVAVVIGYGIGHNYINTANTATTTFSAEGLGNSKAIIYSDLYLGRMNNNSELKGYTYADSEGTWSYTTDPGMSNITLRKLQVWLPVAIGDEEATLEPSALENDNALVYRTGLGDGWGTMVLPFSMTTAQLQEAFGSGVQVANLSAFNAETSVISFEEVSQRVEANKPFLIKGVTQSSPYVIKGVTGTPSTPETSVGGVSFVGTYTNQGSTPFTVNDYFFVASAGSGKLTRVSRNGMRMVLKGYRAYFHIDPELGAKNFTLSFGGEPTGVGSLSPTPPTGPGAVYDLWGRRVGSSLLSLPKGVYIVNGKRVVK